MRLWLIRVNRGDTLSYVLYLPVLRQCYKTLRWFPSWQTDWHSWHSFVTFLPDIPSWQVSFDSPLPPSQQPKNGEAILHAVLRVTTSSGVQVYKAGDVVKLDTKPIIYGKVLHFVKVSKKNDVDKVVVQRQPEEVSIESQNFKFAKKKKVSPLGCHGWALCYIPNYCAFPCASGRAGDIPTLFPGYSLRTQETRSVKDLRASFELYWL